MKKSVLDTIKMRKSIRTYEQIPIKDEQLSLLQQYINKDENLVGPLGGKAKFEIIEVSNNISNKGVKLGTYGFIKNHQGYIVGICENSKNALLQFGYIFEKLILYATQLGLGTCWMGGTFNRTSFKKRAGIK
ncbi:MAG: nitroreductase family protein [Bacillaceae bacterium]|nr:nitroreductase family protein [Bacillaceae bacterium]